LEVCWRPGAPEDNLQIFMEDAKEIWQKEAKQRDEHMCSFIANFTAFVTMPAA